LGSCRARPPTGSNLGPLFVHAYGLAYVVAVAAAIAITIRRWEAKGGNRDPVYEVALWGFPAGIIGGRLYFLATSWNEVPPHWWGPLAVWKGGLGIWGGIAGGTLAGLWVLRRRGANIPGFLDAAAPALLVAQAIGRVGNYFNQELCAGASVPEEPRLPLLDLVRFGAARMGAALPRRLDSAGCSAGWCGWTSGRRCAVKLLAQLVVLVGGYLAIHKAMIEGLTRGHAGR
jgi:prolipoprotein diacylglyceryl transferase